MKYNYVEELMTSPAITCEYTTPIKNAISIMKDNNIGFLPLTKKGILIGLVTDRDILIRGIGTYKLNTKIEKVMTNGNIWFVHPKTPLKEAAKIMAEQKIRRLVVINDGKVIGIITTKNMLNEESLIPFIAKTYLSNKHLPLYSKYTNHNPHDSIKVSDFPL